MSLKLYYHPFASFCQKVLIALYENDTPFEPILVDLGDEVSAAAFQRVWPIRKFPVLCDEAAGLTMPETSIIIEYLDRYYPGRMPLIPEDPGLALHARLWDRYYDQYVAVPVTKVVTDVLRPTGNKDTLGVADAKALLQTAYGLIQEEMAGKKWSAGDSFSLADCAAGPALFYANLVMPFQDTHPNAAAYLGRLMRRPSFARAIEEARPYRTLFPFPESWNQSWVL